MEGGGKVWRSEWWEVEWREGRWRATTVFAPAAKAGAHLFAYTLGGRLLSATSRGTSSPSCRPFRALVGEPLGTMMLKGDEKNGAPREREVREVECC
jgi:hypothetical protein